MEGPSWKTEQHPRYRKLTLSVPAELRERMERAERDLERSGTKPNWSRICSRAIGEFLAGLGK
jgi:hypothetical protein